MKILVVGSEIPATSNMPGSPRLFSLCRYLARRHSLTLATRSRSPERQAEFLADPQVENVFDEQYQTVAGYGTQGRTAYAGIRVKFD